MNTHHPYAMSAARRLSLARASVPRDRCAAPARRGVISILALLFLIIFASLAAGMAMVSQTNLRSADNYLHASKAQAAAETGLDYARFRLAEALQGLTTEKGTVDEALADAMWAQISWRLYNDIGGEAQFQESPAITYGPDGRPRTVQWGPLAMDENDGASFRITFQQHGHDPALYDAGYYQRPPFNAPGNDYTFSGDPVDSENPITNRWLRIRVVGEDRGIARTVQLDLRMDKTMRYAILSRNRVMLGRNVMVRGPVGSHYTDVHAKHGHPLQMRDNFHGLDPQLDGWLEDFAEHLGEHDEDGDNRVNLSDTRETEGLTDPGDLDQNGDGFIDNYDFFVLQYDANGDGALSESEFTDNGQMVDGQLWQMMNEAKYPAGTQFDWGAELVKLPGGQWQDATADMQSIDNEDDYAKIAGQVLLKSGKSAWENGAAEGDYQDFLRGPIIPEEFEDAITFEAGSDELLDVGPEAFDTSTYQAKATGDFAQQVSSAQPNDPAQPTVVTPPGAETLESVPFEAPYPYDHYARPVYENMVFENVTIPKGTNALFVNCKFKGVTFIDTETNNDDPNFNYAGMQEADGSLKYLGVEAEIDGQSVTDTKAHGNNIRFHDCDFEGSIATATPESFSHTRNKLQFTGASNFTTEADWMTPEQKQFFEKSTILAPEYSIDMGTFTQPAASNETVNLEGTIVAGVLDIRGQAEINGSILSTYQPVDGQGPLAEGGSPANFNTTIGYFPSVAGDAEAEVPGDGFGKIIIRYDPDRAMPDGIMGPIQYTTDLDTYFEGSAP